MILSFAQNCLSPDEKGSPRRETIHCESIGYLGIYEWQCFVFVNNPCFLCNKFESLGFGKQGCHGSDALCKEE